MVQDYGVGTSLANAARVARAVAVGIGDILRDRAVLDAGSLAAVISEMNTTRQNFRPIAADRAVGDEGGIPGSHMQVRRPAIMPGLVVVERTTRDGDVATVQKDPAALAAGGISAERAVGNGDAAHRGKDPAAVSKSGRAPRYVLPLIVLRSMFSVP